MKASMRSPCGVRPGAVVVEGGRGREVVILDISRLESKGVIAETWKIGFVW
jgi:hypothetical protein